jgi:pimeloyl-ACP methyl ester carboxylesterase
MQVIVDGLLTTYEVTGSGKLIVLLHGWADSHQGFKDLQQELSKKYKVLSLDLPGFGNTQRPKIPWNLDNYAHFVHDVIDKLDYEKLYAIVGHSNGGGIAIRAVGEQILSPERLVLLAPAGIRSGNSIRKSTLKAIAKTGKVATLWMPYSYRKKLRSRLYGVVGSDMLIVPEMQETFKRTVSQDIQADARNLKIPTLLIFAENDRAVPLSNGQRLRSLIPYAKLEVLSQAGHFVHLEQPEKVRNLIEEFLA